MSNDRGSCVVCGNIIYRHHRYDKKTCSGKCRATLARRKKNAELVAIRVGNDLELLLSSYQMGAIDEELSANMLFHIGLRFDKLKSEIEDKSAG